MGAELTAKDLDPTPNENYRVEKIDNGYILHVTRGAGGKINKIAFMDKAALLAHLDKVL